MLQALFIDGIKLFAVLVGLSYAVLVLTGYITEGSRYRIRFHLGEPTRSGERLLVWTGIKVVATVISVLKLMFNELFVASGELAGWAISRSSPKLQREVHSRFL